MKSQRLALLLFLIIACGTLCSGTIPLANLLHNLKEHFSLWGRPWNPLLDERLPRLIVLLLSGASVAVAGAVSQALFQNPLATPGILGIQLGGSLAALLVLIWGFHLPYPFSLPLAAFIGCFGTLLLLYRISKQYGGMQLHLLILTGLSLSTLLVAIQGALLYSLRNEWQLLQTIAEWEAGSSADRSWLHVALLLPPTILGLACCWGSRKELNLLSLGEEEARNLGVEVEKLRWKLFLSVALLSAGALSALGTVAFLGLLLPHLIRKVSGPNHQTLIPLCAVWGGLTLSGLDLLLRTFELHWLSVGNISAVLGALFFFFLLLEQARVRSSYA